ncbi:MAG: chorismate mutase [Acidobacteriia bacterium]|nr:chorismate mutase [Terriglobia bacterium]
MNGPIQDTWELVQQRRNEIDRLDSELLRLLSRRARISLDLAAIKKSSGLPLYDGKRELQVIERMCLQNPGPLGPENVTSIFRCIIEEARRAGEKQPHPVNPELLSEEKADGHQYGGKRVRS